MSREETPPARALRGGGDVVGALRAGCGWIAAPAGVRSAS